MLNHKKLIEELTPEQKIALLVDTGVSNDETEQQTDLPRLVAADLWAANKTETGEGIFPGAGAMANSFDTDLFRKVAEHLAKMGKEKGQNLFVLPDTKAPYHIYGEGLSEDPYLNAQYVKAIADELGHEHAAIAMRAPALTERDVKFLHGEVDMRVLFDRTARPFRTAVSEASVHAILLPESPVPQEYAEANSIIMQKTVSSRTAVLCSDVSQDDTISALNENKILLGASTAALQAALDNYNHIRRSVEEGGSTVEELNSALITGAAVSEDMLDAALDRRLSLAQKCLELQGSAGAPFAQEEGQAPDTPHVMQDPSYLNEVQGLALDAARKSIVMLKNHNKVLPLSIKKRIAVIGDISGDSEESGFSHFRERFATQMHQQAYHIVGFSKGYHLERERSEELIPEALYLADNADVLIVFLGMGKRREARIAQTHTLQLPANQLALFDALSKTGKPIIAVVSGTRLPAMGFDRRAAGVIMIPDEGVMVPQALAEVLAGYCNPSGRLAFTGYDEPDTDFKEIQKHIRSEKRKTGPFIGYRYYVSEGLTVKYPFGFGLSYCDFAYSDLVVYGDQVQFTLQNKSRYDGVESAQIYVGKQNSVILRPQMELKSVIRVPLRGGHRSRITINLEDLGVYDPHTGGTPTEQGEYEIYVSNAAETKPPLQAKTMIYGRALTPQEYDLSDYLHTVSDIRTNSYTMEASCEPMKNRTILKTLGIALMVLTLFADVIYLTCGMLTFLNLYKSYFWVSITSAVFMGAGLVLLIVYLALHSKATRAQRLKEEEATELLFRDAEEVEGESIEELFVEEFDIPEEQIKIENTTYTEKDEGLYAYMEVDTTLPAIAAEMEKFFNDRGVTFTPELARTVLSAVATSRLLIVRTELHQMFKTFVTLLGEFFGSEAYCDRFAKDGNSLLRYKGADGAWRESNLLQTIYTAQTQKEKPHFVGFSHTRFEHMGDVMMPYIRYFSNPQNVCTIKEEELTVTMPSNLWFVLGVADGETLENIEPFVANYAAVIDLTSQWSGEAEEKTQPAPLYCAQLEALVYRAKRDTLVEEDLWKSVDRLEAFVNERSPYHIGNKLFLLLERYIAVYSVCGGDMQAAMDAAVAAKLLPAILAVLNGNAAPEDLDFAHTLESIFGEDLMPQSCYMFKHAQLQMEPGDDDEEEDEDDVDEIEDEDEEEEDEDGLNLSTLSAVNEWQEDGFDAYAVKADAEEDEQTEDGLTEDEMSEEEAPVAAEDALDDGQTAADEEFVADEPNEEPVWEVPAEQTPAQENEPVIEDAEQIPVLEIEDESEESQGVKEDVE